MKTQREIFAENLQRLVNERKIDQRDLAIKLEVSDTSISNWLNGKKYPRINHIQQLAEYFNVNKSELIEENIPNLERISPRTVRIPILGKIACGDPIDSEQNIEGYRYEFAEGLPSGDLVSLVADGDSMFPTIQDGSFVTFKKQSVVEEGQIAAVRFLETGEMTLKRIKRQGNMMLLVPDNKDYDIIVVTHDNPAEIVGKVVRVTVDF